MWFVSGLVLIYYPFPNVTKSQLYEKKETFPASLPALEDILSGLPAEDSDIRSLQARQFQGQTLFTVQTKENTYTLCADSLQTPLPVTWETIQRITGHWIEAPVLTVDTLYERDQWIMYSSYLKELPIYKFYFDDEEKHQLYIASRTGEVLQFTTARERLWAWLGAIPHKFYLPFIRKHTELWINALTIAGIIGMLVALTGLYVGIYALRKKYKSSRKTGSPYKKQWYRWHHLTGLLFGVFLVTWAFSGAMSMQRIPQWVIKTYGDYRTTPSKLKGKRLPLSAYVLDYRSVYRRYPNVKEIEWSYFRSIPVYNIVVGNHTLNVDASGTEAKELSLSQEEVGKAIRAVHGEDSFTISILSAYEEYYLPRKETLPLPVYKVEIMNKDKSLYYIDPRTGDFKYFNRSRKAKKWIFNGLHYLHIQWLWERPVLWTITIWTLCIGGTIVSFTGILLSIRYLVRKGKKWIHS
jgi:hypothetical protein